MEKNTKMPLLGPGPIYVATILLISFMTIFLSERGYITSPKLDLFIFKVLGVLLILVAIYLWVSAVIFSKISRHIREQSLVTDGVYGQVRNPIYSAFLHLATGILVYHSHPALFILPPIYWAYLTILLKNTEEIWLQEAFGQEYRDYCKKVNRCLPKFHLHKFLS